MGRRTGVARGFGWFPPALEQRPRRGVRQLFILFRTPCVARRILCLFASVLLRCAKGRRPSWLSVRAEGRFGGDAAPVHRMASRMRRCPGLFYSRIRGTDWHRSLPLSSRPIMEDCPILTGASEIGAKRAGAAGIKLRPISSKKRKGPKKARVAWTSQQCVMRKPFNAMKQVRSSKLGRPHIMIMLPALPRSP